MLLICFVVAAICTFLIIITLQIKNSKATAQRNAANIITPDETSTNSVHAVKMKKARPSPEGGRASQRGTPLRGSPQRGSPFALNYGTNEPGGMQDSETRSRGDVIFVDSSASRPANQNNENTPLLGEDAKSTTTAGEFEFGVLSEASGLWYRDHSGRHIIRFVVLLLLLVFSSLVVSWPVFSFWSCDLPILASCYDGEECVVLCF